MAPSCDFSLDFVSKKEEGSFKIPLELPRGFNVFALGVDLLSTCVFAPKKYQKSANSSERVFVENVLNIIFVSVLLT